MQNEIQDKHAFNINIIKRILACMLSTYSNLQYI
jgi:hypothetical protein